MESYLKNLFQNIRQCLLITNHRINVLHQNVTSNILHSKDHIENFEYAIHRMYELLKKRIILAENLDLDH